MQAVPSEFLAIDRKERANRPFFDLDLRSPEVRTCDFDDVVIEFDPEQAMVQAARCIHCPDPAPCMVACPTANDIPSAMWLIEQGRFVEAAGIYHKTSSLPEVCGRVCPHEALCQGSCVLNKHHQPVLCGELEAFTVDYERRTEGHIIPVGTPNGKKVAVIGAGPAGLGCADLLIQKGYDVTVFESKPAPGGLLVYGIPNFKLPKDVWEEKWEEFERAGVKFVPNTYIGKDKTIDGLFEEGFEAVFIGVGSEIDAKMEDTPGTDLEGVFEATDFLIRGNLEPEQLPENMRKPLEIGKRVVVIGGGDTASDCLRTALRLGAEDVTCLYRRTEKEMPGGKKDRKMAREEGAKYRFLTQPVKFIAGADGKLAAVECISANPTQMDAANLSQWKLPILVWRLTQPSSRSAIGPTPSSARPPRSLRYTIGDSSPLRIKPKATHRVKVSSPAETVSLAPISLLPPWSVEEKPHLQSTSIFKIKNNLL